MDTYRQSIVGSFLFILGVLLSMSAYFSDFNMISSLVIVSSIILLLAGIKILASSNLPVLNIFVGISFATILFEQANISGGHVSLLMAIGVLAISLQDYRKETSRDV